jgi:hypothetical protein
MAHGMGSKVPETDFLGGTVFQSDLVVIPTPLLVHRSSQPLCKKLLRIKSYAILHYMVCRTGQFVSQGSMSYHKLALRRLSIIIRPRVRIVTPCQLGSLRKGPGQILVAIFFVPVPFLLPVTCPATRDLSTIGGVITH